jgi:hypothetical protein
MHDWLQQRPQLEQLFATHRIDWQRFRVVIENIYSKQKKEHSLITICLTNCGGGSNKHKRKQRVGLGVAMVSNGIKGEIRSHSPGPETDIKGLTHPTKRKRPLSHGLAYSKTPSPIMFQCHGDGGFKKWAIPDFDHTIKSTQIRLTIRLALNDWHTVWVTQFRKKRIRHRDRMEQVAINLSVKKKRQ